MVFGTYLLQKNVSIISFNSEPNRLGDRSDVMISFNFFCKWLWTMVVFPAILETWKPHNIQGCWYLSLHQNWDTVYSIFICTHLDIRTITYTIDAIPLDIVKIFELTSIVPNIYPIILQCHKKWIPIRMKMYLSAIDSRADNGHQVFANC